MTPITLFSALVVRKAFDEILPAFERLTGIEVDAVYDPTVQLLKRVDAGEGFDVLVAATGSLPDFGATLVPGTGTPILRTAIGIAVLSGAPHPDISTTAAFIGALRAARSVAYSRTGQSGIYFAELLTRLGIAEEINPRATILEKGFTAEALVDGRADLAVQQLSELMFVPGNEIVGPLPDELQHLTEFSVATSSRAAARPEPQAFIDFLRSPTARDAFRATRLSPTGD